MPARNARAVGPAFLAVVFAFGAVGLAQDYRQTLAGERRSPGGRAAVRLLSRNLEGRMRAQGYGSARIRMAPPVWGVASGVVLQLYKTDISIAVTDPLVWMFTEALRSTGTEDVVFRFVGPALDEELRGRSDHLLLGRTTLAAALRQEERDVSVYEQLRRRR